MMVFCSKCKALILGNYNMIYQDVEGLPDSFVLCDECDLEEKVKVM